MRIISSTLIIRSRIIRILAVCLAVLLLSCRADAGRVVRVFVSPDSSGVLETLLGPVAAGSDSIYCDGRLLEPGADYRLNLHTGRLTFLHNLLCDSMVVTVFRIPDWLTAPYGNPVPGGKRLLRVETDNTALPPPGTASAGKIRLSGNKTFSFTVGRSGEGRFSQGLNVDFDARVAEDFNLRGSISDRIGAGQQLVSGQGGTAILSELDKYYLEIDGPRVLARGGDIATLESRYLPAKRIKGIAAGYSGTAAGVFIDLGRPAGRYVSQRVTGIDGRQGPYQAVGGNGVPTGIVPGSERVYLDGQLLESGAGKHYEIDYPSGRITFSPRVLITSRSRIEIDFEAAAGDYEQVIYDLVTHAGIWNDRIRFSAGGRREEDDRDRLRFGSLSAADFQNLARAGDSASQAFVSGVIADSTGDYVRVVDTAGNDFYQYAGSGAGDYAVSFSFIGEGRGDYQYLGDGVYQYVGRGSGTYLPVRYLPLPRRNDFFFSAVEISPYSGGAWRLEYQGNARDNNLLSTLGDGDNFKSQVIGGVSHTRGTYSSEVNIRYRQEAFDPVYRVDRPDNSRLWALPASLPTGDELRLDVTGRRQDSTFRVEAGGGYLGYKDELRSHRVNLAARVWETRRVSPHMRYQAANSESQKETGRDGLYERYNPGLSIKPIGRVRVDLEYDRELAKDRYAPVPRVEKYDMYRGMLYYRGSVLTVSRRVEFESAGLGFKGPRQDKVEFTAEESIGRVNISLAGTWFDQKQLDSDRGDRLERLYIAAFRYTPASSWLTLQAEYRQNRTSARSFDYRYVRVNSGEGNYRLEDGRYLPDPDGDYVRIREERGSAESVALGEKNHNIVIYPGRLSVLKRFRPVLSQVAFRLRTEIAEELPGDDRRRASWILPWTSRAGLGYLRRERREAYSLLLFPSFNFYIVNLACRTSFEERESGALLFRTGKEYDIELKNSLSRAARSSLQWRHRRDRESGVGIIALTLVRNEYSAGLAITPARWQVTPRITYAIFSDRRSGGEGSGVTIANEAVWRQPDRGEVRVNLELRSLNEKVPFSQPEYLITDGRRFGKSALFNLVVNYDIGRSLRLTVNLADRVHESRPAEFMGRGELVARF